MAATRKNASQHLMLSVACPEIYYEMKFNVSFGHQCQKSQHVEELRNIPYSMTKGNAGLQV